MPSRIPAVAAALFFALAVPAAAQVPVIEPLKPCYVTAGTAKKPQGEGVGIRAAGFTPNSKVDLTVNGQPLNGSTGLQVGEMGQLALDPFPAPFVRRGSQDFTVTLTQVDDTTKTASATAKSTRLTVDVKPKRARPSQRIQFSGSGFTDSKPVYAHYTYDGKQVRRVRMARRTGECGAWSVRKPQFPMDDPDQGRWIIQFDQSKRYVNGNSGRLPSVYVRLRVNVSLERG
jgi:hypothetical protein